MSKNREIWEKIARNCLFFNKKLNFTRTSRISRGFVLARPTLASPTIQGTCFLQISHIMNIVLIMHYTAGDITHSLHTHTSPTHMINPAYIQGFDHRPYNGTSSANHWNRAVVRGPRLHLICRDLHLLYIAQLFSSENKIQAHLSAPLCKNYSNPLASILV